MNIHPKEISYLSNYPSSPYIILYIIIFILFNKNKISSNRKINNGYFAHLIDFSQRISLIKDEKITSNFTPEWTNFITEKVNNWMNLFNRRLCYEDKTKSFFMNSMEKHEEENDNKETEEKNENNVKLF